MKGILMKASVIISTYNKLPRLMLTIASIENQTCNHSDFEVIIVNNNSTDGTGNFLQAQNFNFDFTYCLERRLGRSHGRNLGIKIAKNPLLIFIDDDMLLPNVFIEQHINAHKSKHSVVHGKIYNILNLKFFADPLNAILYEVFNENKSKLILLNKKHITMDDIQQGMDKIISQNKKTSNFEKLINTIFDNKFKDYYWLGFTGGNVSILKEWVINSGAFDESFGSGWGFEDVELGYRIWKKYTEFTYCCDASNYHMDHYRFNFKEESTATANYFYAKHKDENIKFFIEFSLGNYSLSEAIEKIKTKS